MRKFFFLLAGSFFFSTAFSQRIWQWQNLATLPPALYQKAVQKQQGIIVMDDLFPSIAHIGMGTVSKEAIRSRATHFPIDGFKRPHTGVMTYLHRRPLGVFDKDDDVNMYILPNPGDNYFESFKATGKSKATEVEGEIDVMTAFWGNIAQQFPKRYAQSSGYGPWVWEHHDYFDSRPHDYIEMHPMEHMWRADLINGKLQYNVALFSDNTGGDMQKWRPNPVITISAIAFDFAKGQRPLEYVIDQKENFNTLPYPLYTDNAKVHVLMDGKDTLAIVREPANTASDIYSIEFVAVSKSGRVIGKNIDSAKAVGGPGDIFGTRYTGFIKVHAAVKNGGHNMFSVTEKSRTISPKVRVEVQFVSIHCDAVDDDDDTEDLYGSYGVSASVGESPYHLNAYCPGATSTLWERGSFEPLKLKKGQTSIINAVRFFMVSPAGEIVVYGDLDEKDTGIGGGGDNDELSPPKHQRFKVAEMSIGTPVLVDDRYTSGGTKVNAIYIVKRVN